MGSWHQQGRLRSLGMQMHVTLPAAPVGLSHRLPRAPLPCGSPGWQHTWRAAEPPPCQRGGRGHAGQEGCSSRQEAAEVGTGGGAHALAAQSHIGFFLSRCPKQWLASHPAPAQLACGLRAARAGNWMNGLATSTVSSCPMRHPRTSLPSFLPPGRPHTLLRCVHRRQARPRAPLRSAGDWGRESARTATETKDGASR